MNSKIPDDLFSAFLDREVTAEEEAAALARLQASSQDKQEFQDYQRLSELLHELPRHTVPPEFAATVMQRAERETLIPLDGNVAVASDAHAKSPARRTWILAVAGTAAIAASALVFVTWHGREDRRAVVVAANESPAVVQPKGAPRSVAFEPAPPTVMLKDTDRVDMAKLDAARNTAPAQQEARASIAAASPKRPMSTASPSLALAKRAGANTQRLVFPANLKTAEVGDVIEALENVGERVAVVRLLVVNQATGLGGVQSLLVRDTSRTVQNADEIEALKRRFTEKGGTVAVEDHQKSNATGDLICVLVEGTPEQLASVLQDVQKESQIQGAELKNTISAEKLAEYANRQQTPALASRQRAQSSSQSVVSLPAAVVDQIYAEKAPAQTLDQNSATGVSQKDFGFQQAKKSDQAQAKMVTAADKSVAPSGQDQSNQFQYQNKPAAESSKVAASQQNPTAHFGDVDQKKHASSRVASKQVAAAAQRPIQVFFVIDDSSVAQSQSVPVPPAATPAAPAEPQPVDPPQPKRRRRRPVVARRPVPPRPTASPKDAD